MKAAHLFFLFAFLLGFASCNSDAPSQERTPSAEEADATNITETGSDNLPTEHWHLVGGLGSMGIFMDLFLLEDGYANYAGYYYYDKYEEPIFVYGARDSSGLLQIAESPAGEAENTGQFYGEITPAGRYFGTWTSPDGKKTLPFNLYHDLSSGSVAFEVVKMVDSLALYPDQEDSPQAMVSDTWLLPTDATDSSVRDFLTRAFIEDVMGDSIANQISTPQASFDYRKKTFFGYQKEEAAMLAEEPNLWSERVQDLSMEVLFNDGRWLTMSYNFYEFSGGAHGNYGSNVVTYHLEDSRRVTLEDVFKPGYEAVLTAALEQAFRKTYELAPTDEITDLLLTEKIEPNDNFGITGKGIIFNYVPYEIAPYTVGQIRLYLPFAGIKEVVKTEML